VTVDHRLAARREWPVGAFDAGKCSDFLKPLSHTADIEAEVS